MARNRMGKGPFGLRITPDDIRTCFAFLRRAVALVARGLPGVELGPRPARRFISGHALRGIGARPSWPAAAFRRRP
jgi:hypothetical protein